MEFIDLGIDQSICVGLKKEKINTPTKVQEAVIQKILEQKDIIAQSETGSGKTLAYLIPLYQKMIAAEKGMQVLILVPTHELAMQVHRQIKRLSENSGIAIRSATIFGDVNINRQIENLKEKPQIIIGTTGRILELIKKRKITAHTIQTIVVDEADKLLDKNNMEGVRAVIKCCMRDTQLLLFSASIPESTVADAVQLAKNPEIIKTNENLTIPKNIDHIYFVVERREKVEYLRKLAKSLKPKKAMVFINKVSDIEEMTQKLQYHHYSAECIHGSNLKKDRKKVIQDYQEGRLQFLIATDIAARGLHFDGVSTVFHLSIPEDPMDYLHRAGRCGRGSEKGLSVLLVTKEEISRIKTFQKAFGINILEKKMYQGKVVRG
jgi:Superfamily II DNA and RNA helicases